MSCDDLLNQVLKHLVQSNGRLNTKKAYSTPFLPLVDAINQQTSFLQKDATLAARVAALRAGITSAPTCKICGAETKYQKQTQTFATYCSNKCVQADPDVRNKIETTCLERYGVVAGCVAPAALKKQKATNRIRYGTDKPFQSPEIQQKVRETVSRFGVTSTALLPNVAATQAATNIDRYGAAKPFQSLDIQQKVTNTHAEKYGVKRFSMSTVPQSAYQTLNDRSTMMFLHHVEKQTLGAIGDSIGVSDVTVGTYMKSHGIETRYFMISAGEQQVAQLLTDVGVEQVRRNVRDVIDRYELDIYLPDHQLAIEFCGLYWHGENRGKDRWYHRNKYLKCRQQGIQLITMYDYEWNARKTIVQNKLRTIIHKTNTPCVYARNCVVEQLNRQQKENFFDSYHIQGSGPGSVNYGLFYEGRLVAAITFILSDKEVILNRYATSTRVVGGFTKLLTHFQRNHSWKRIISFADLRWSTGALYERTGFTLEAELPPDYAYIVGNQPMHKFAFRHKSLAKKLSNYDSTLTEWENMKAHGYDRIWDCGKLRYALHAR